ncbi:TetR/AcrR family transcriptional regulator [Caulobacter segnis]|uniref:TetR/AcrR family transcriptional regulator n=1 Tax=Caulobacter segnis TaxID=88688 RepID=UPI0024107565|nr:TetR/AcrR family transcriptional regulator [Caulobacter segnis]MDG2522633.1 TetR/AcrR family transcriptional regulator [Caulobacter segnis]
MSDTVQIPSKPEDAAPRRAGDKVLDAAESLFYAQGIRAVGVEEIVNVAGVGKPSLYRAFGSKDELTAAVLQRQEGGFWSRLDAAVAAHPDDPRAAITAYFHGAAERSKQPDYRGCAHSNAAVEYPQASLVRAEALGFKRRQRERLTTMARAMGAADPQALADELLLLLEGVYVTRQVHGPDGPAQRAGEAAEALIARHLGA